MEEKSGAMLKDRVIARLNALGINAFEAARRGGFERTFVNEIVRGRKRMLQPRNLPRLAKALECSVAYLTGNDPDPGTYQPGQWVPSATEPVHDLGSGLDFQGIVEMGTLRNLDYLSEAVFSAVLPIGRDARYPLAEQGVYQIQDRALEDLHICPGMLVVTVSCEDYTAHYGPITVGMLVVVERLFPALDKIETCALEVAKGQTPGMLELVPRTKASRYSSLIHPLHVDGVEQKITGIIKRAIQVF